MPEPCRDRTTAAEACSGIGGTADAAIAAESVEEVTASELGTAQLELLVGEQLGERVLPGEDRIEREPVV
jgi:hypothetical protein